MENFFDELKKEYYKTNRFSFLIKKTVEILMGFPFFILMMVFFYQVYSMTSLNFLAIIILSPISGLIVVACVLIGINVEDRYEKWDLKILNKPKNSKYKSLLNKHEKCKSLEEKITNSYIKPLLRKRFFKVRKYSDIKSIEVIESYYYEYINLFKELYPLDSDFLAEELQKKEFNISYAVRFMGSIDRAEIFANYHCLATYLPDEEAEEIDSFWRRVYSKEGVEKNDYFFDKLREENDMLQRIRGRKDFLIKHLRDEEKQH